MEKGKGPSKPLPVDCEAQGEGGSLSAIKNEALSYCFIIAWGFLYNP
jgi:hypothetical protein